MVLISSVKPLADKEGDVEVCGAGDTFLGALEPNICKSVRKKSAL